MYATLKQTELDDLLAATNAPGSAVRVTLTATSLNIGLSKVVAVSNYKALAHLGRGWTTFDAGTKTTRIPLRDKSAFKDGGMLHGAQVLSDGQGYVYSDGWATAAVILALHCEEKDELLKFVRRLSGGKVKTFKTIADARTARAQKRSAAPTYAPGHGHAANRQVWSDDEGDVVLAGEGWRA